MKQAFAKIFTFILFLLLFPYTITLLTCGLHRGGEEQDLVAVDSPHVVVAQSAIGSIELSMEEYIIGAMASCIDPTYELATLESQAIILRTNLRIAEQRGGINLWEDILQYYDIEMRRRAWGDSYEIYQDKFTQAVMNTANMVITVEGELVPLSFHAVSAGMTRDGNEVFQSESYGYSQSVECQYDIMAEDYLQTVVISMKKIQEIFGEFIKEEEKNLNIAVTEVDQAGYVVSLQVGEAIIAGEEFREVFQLPSAHFTMKVQGEDLIITTKGKGHGLGLSQYSANAMALQGKDFMEILGYFYQTIKIEVGV